jgi:hypothetical protein
MLDVVKVSADENLGTCPRRQPGCGRLSFLPRRAIRTFAFSAVVDKQNVKAAAFGPDPPKSCCVAFHKTIIADFIFTRIAPCPPWRKAAWKP